MTQNIDDQNLDADFQSALAEDSKAHQPVPVPESTPDLYASPTYQKAIEDGTLSDASWTGYFDKWSKELEESRQKGEAGGYGGVGMLSKEETQAEAQRRKDALSGPPSMWENLRVALNPGHLGRAEAASRDDLMSGDPARTAAAVQRMAADVRKSEAEQLAKDREDETAAVARILGNPNAQIPGLARSTAEYTVQASANIVGAIVESIGIGGELAGRGAGLWDKVGDNAVQAMGRWAQSGAAYLFPGDPLRQKDFSAAMGQGVGSTLGFWGADAGAKILGLARKGEWVTVALTGALSQANQPFNDAKKTKDVSDAQLAMAYIGGLALGATEAVPVIENIPGLSRETKNKAIAFLSTIHREGLEEGMQEFVQQLGQNIIAKHGVPGIAGYKPDQDLWEDVGPNAIVGYLSGAGITAARLAKSRQAREQALIEARGGHAPDTGRPAAISPPPAPEPSAVQPFTIDLDKYGAMPEPQPAAPAAPAGDGTYPAPQPVPAFEPGADLAGSARMKDGSAGGGGGTAPVAVNPQIAPTFDDIRPLLPLDANGDMDIEHLYRVSEELTGKRYWNQLNVEERDAVATVLAAQQQGVDPAQALAEAQAAKVQAVQTAQPGAQPAAAAPAQQKAVSAPVQAPGAAPATAAPRSQIGDKEAAAALARAREVTRDAMDGLNETSDGSPASPAFDNLGEYDAALAGIEREKADMQASAAALEAQLAAETNPRKRRALESALASTQQDIDTLDAEAAAINKGRDGLSALQPDMFDPALAAAEQLYDGKAPAASWPSEALRAGEKAGLVRLDNEGTPRRAPRPVVDTSIDDGLTDQRKAEILGAARAASGPVRPARFGESHANGDPAGVRALVDSLNAIDTESLKAGFQRFANLGRARNRAQVIAKIASGLMAHELAVQDVDYKLSNSARELIDQTVEDALRPVPVPIETTVETVAADEATNAVVDHVLQATKYIDKDAVAIAREHGIAALRQMLEEAPSKDLQQVITGNGLNLITGTYGNRAIIDGIIGAVQMRLEGREVPRTIADIAKAMGKLEVIGIGDAKAGTPKFNQIVDAAKASSVRAPEKTVDEFIAEASGDKVETGFDPYALGAVAKLKREGEAKLREALGKLSEGEILSLAMAQHLAPVHMGAKAAMVEQVVQAARQRLAERRGNMADIVPVVAPDVVDETLPDDHAVEATLAGAPTQTTGVQTVDLPGYGTEAFERSREFRFDGETVVGYEAAVARLVSKAIAYAGPDGVANERKATLLIGPPGAGKSHIAKKLAVATRSAFSTADDAKFVIPEFQQPGGAMLVHEESTEIGQRVSRQLIEDGANIIIEKLGSNSGSITMLVDRLAREGYAVELVAVTADRDTLVKRIAKRAAETGSDVPIDEVGKALSGISKTIGDMKTRADVGGVTTVDTSLGSPHITDGGLIHGEDAANLFAPGPGRPGLVRSSGGPGDEQAGGVAGPEASGHDGDGVARQAATPAETVARLEATYNKPVTAKARRFAVALFAVGTDGKLYHDLVRKMMKKGGANKADLDAIAYLYAGAGASRTRALALGHIDAEFLKRSRVEADAAIIAGDKAIITREVEDNADDRRRGQRDQRVQAGARALSEGILSGGVRPDAEGRDAGGEPAGNGAGGEGDVRSRRAADPGAGAGEAGRVLPGHGGSTEAGTGDGQRSGGGGAYSDAAVVEAVEQANKEREERRRSNYQISDEDQIGTGGAKAKVRANIAAIRIVKQLAEENRPATPEEKRALVKFVGWGAFAQAVFNERNDEFKTERQQLTDLLSADEFAAARASTLNAHYTSRDVIDGMWEAMKHLGFTGGKALEPAAGIGHFIGMEPKALQAVTDWTAVELDPISGAITKHLYEGSDVRVQGFETVAFPDSYFDLAISNVPFGQYSLSDRKYPKMLIHDYFFAKSLDKVREGGVVAFITSSGTMDKESGAVRRLLAEKADLVGAIRLPGGDKGAFASNAGTEVTTDIIFLRKRVAGEQANHAAPWMDVTEIKTPEGKTKINAYFAAHPEMMLGKMRLTGSMYRAQSPVLIGSSANLKEKIIAAASNMPANVFTDATQTIEDVAQKGELAEAGIKEGAFYLKGGKLFQNVNGEAVAQKASGKVLKRFRSLMDIRDIVNDLLSGVAKGGTDASAEHLRAKLNTSYDKFVAEFGPINKESVSVQTRKIKGETREITTVRYPNLDGFRDDPDAFKVAAIEEFDSQTQTARKRAIFTTDIVGAYERPQIAGPAEALAVSLNEAGRVDMRRIADMLKVSEAEAAKALGERVFKDPAGERYTPAELYLSGDVVTKLEQAREIAKTNPEYDRNVTALEAVQPAPLTRVDIRTTFGAPWIPTDVYNEFIAKVIGIRGGDVKFEKVTSQWIYTNPNKPFINPAAQSAYGTDRVKVTDLVLAALNDKPVRVFNTVRENGSEVKVLDAKATEDAAIKVKLIAETFTGDQNSGMPGWVYEDETRAQTLEAVYNTSFNRLVPTKYDGSHLIFPGMSRTIMLANGNTAELSLRGHRANAIWRVIQSGNMLMDHCVGSGKTFAMIAAAMEMKRLGQIQRPMFAVPNHMLEQFTREFYVAYPNAKLLVAEKKHMEAKNRKAFAARIAADKWDGIIITHSAFGRLPMKAAAYEDFYKAQMDEIVEAWLAAKAAAGEANNGKASRDPTVKQIERKKKAIEAKLDKLMAEERKDSGVTFEETGVDYIIVDEAHLFKNLDYQSRHSNVKGIGVKGSQRSTDLFLKIQHLEKARPGRSALFATATPMSRSMAEIYTMQRYLQLPLLKEYGVDRFDTWAATFGKIITQTELAPNGRDFKDTTSFSKFVNVPELQALYSRVADSVTADDINLPRPKLAGGRPQMVEAELSGDEEDAIQRVIREIAALNGPVEKGKDNHLSLFTRGLQISTDMRLVDPMAEFNPNGKIAKLVSKVSEIYKAGAKPALAQMIFLDMGVPSTRAKAKVASVTAVAEDENKIEGVRAKLAQNEDDDADEAAEEAAQIEEMLAGKFNLYDDIKKRLVAEGIPAKEIAFVHDAKNDQQKAQLFKAVREGKVRVLLGSTGRMGVGTNVQRYLIAMHHVDAPWNPADVVQRDGRIIRQGNLNPEVSVYRYITKRSFEAYRWQLLDRKAQFEAQFRAGARGLREAEDIDSPLPEAADLKAAATGDPRIMEYAELTRTIRELEAAKRGHERSSLNARAALASTKATIAQYQTNLAKYEQDVQLVTDLRGDNFKMRLDTATAQGEVTKREKAGVAIRDAILSAMRYHWGRDSQEIDVGSISGFKATVSAWKGEHGIVAKFGVEGAAAYEAIGGAAMINGETDPVGIAKRYENIVLGITGLAVNARRVIAEKTQDAARLEKQATPTPFPKAVQLAAAKARHEELERALKPKGPQTPPTGGAPVDTEAKTEAEVDAALASLVSDIPGMPEDQLSSLAGGELEWALRQAKTATVKALVPKRVRDVLAGAVLYGRARDARERGWPEVADRMQAKAAAWASGNRAEPSPDGTLSGNHSAPFARPAGDRLAGPFVGDREARYQDDMRLHELRRTIAEEIRNAEQERIARAGVGIDREGGSAAEGQPQAPAADQGRGQGASIGERLADPVFRARAIDAFLSPELRKDAIEARASAQGFTTIAYHARQGTTPGPINAFRPGSAFGFHASVGEPAGANARIGYPTTFLDKLYAFLDPVIGGRRDDARPANVARVRMRVEKSLRMPHVTALNYGHWHEPMAWIAGMKHPDFDGPESLRRFVAGWMAENGVTLESPRVGDHRFSRALAAELDRLGYDSVIYRDTAQGVGRDSLFVWDASRIRSAFDFFHQDASGAEGLTASDDYVNQDLEARLRALKEEEGLTEAEVYTFDEMRTDDGLGELSAIEENNQPQSEIVNPIDADATDEQKLAQVEELTKENEALVEALAKRIDERIGTKSGVSRKMSERIVEKAHRPSILRVKPWHRLEHVRDTYRFRTDITSFDQVIPAFEEILKAGLRPVKIDTVKMFQPKEWGWPMIAYDLRAPNGQIIEYQQFLDELKHAKKAGGRAIFEKWRNLTPEQIEDRKAEYLKDQALSLKLYAEARDAALSKMGFASVTEAKAAWDKISASLPVMAEKFWAKSFGSMTGTSAPSAQFPEVSRRQHLTRSPSTSVTWARPVSRSSQTEMGMNLASLGNVGTNAGAVNVPGEVLTVPKTDVEGWLRNTLSANGVDPSAFGRGKSRSLQALTDELASGEAQLVRRNGRIERHIRPLGLDIYARVNGQLMKLREDRQVFKDGRTRKRDLATSIGEKMLPGETPADAARRALSEELGVTKFALSRKLSRSTQERTSSGYPGLPTVYDVHETAVMIDPSEFKPEGYTEEQPEKTNYTVWDRVDPGKVGDELSSLTAWHGSPHDIDGDFSLDRVGTGEGHQSYGFGIYFGEAQGTGESYAESTAKFVYTLDGKPITNDTVSVAAYRIRKVEPGRRDAEVRVTPEIVGKALASWVSDTYGTTADDPDVASEVGDMRAALDSMLGKMVGGKMQSNLYRVKINVDYGDLLHLEKPISEQSQKVRELLVEHEVVLPSALTDPYAFGSKAYSYLEDDIGTRAAARFLAEIGIPGLMYADQGTRGETDASKVTHNFVIFDTSVVEITHKNGAPVSQSERDDILSSLKSDNDKYDAALQRQQARKAMRSNAIRGGRMTSEQISALEFARYRDEVSDDERRSGYTSAYRVVFDDVYGQTVTVRELSMPEPTDLPSYQAARSNVLTDADTGRVISQGHNGLFFSDELRAIAEEIAAERVGLDGSEPGSSVTGNKRLTPAAQAQYGAILKDVETRLRQMMPGDVGLRFAERLFAVSGQEQYGRFRPLTRIIELSLAYGPENAFAHGAHEIVHALRNAGAFTDEEWAALVERAGKIDIPGEMNLLGLTTAYTREARKQAARMGLTGDLANEFVARRVEEEQVARLAQKHFAAPRSRFGAKVDALLQRMADVLSTIIKAFNGRGFTTAGQVFRRMETGQIAKRVTPAKAEPKVAANDQSDIDAMEVGRMWSSLMDRKGNILVGKKRPQPRRLTIDYGRYSRSQVIETIDELERRLARMEAAEYPYNEVDTKELARYHLQTEESLALFKAALARFDVEKFPRGKPFAPSKIIEAPNGFVVRMTTDERHGADEDSRVFRIFAPKDAAKLGDKPPSRALRTALGQVDLTRHPDGRWEVSMVEVREKHQGKGVAKALYAAVEQELGIEMRPSGILLEPGYEMWKRRNPDLVKWHRPIGEPGYARYYASPKYLYARIEGTQRSMAFAQDAIPRLEKEIAQWAADRDAGRVKAEDADRYINDLNARFDWIVRSITYETARIAEYQRALDSVPAEGKTPEALGQMFAIKNVQDRAIAAAEAALSRGLDYYAPVENFRKVFDNLPETYRDTVPEGAKVAVLDRVEALNWGKRVVKAIGRMEDGSEIELPVSWDFLRRTRASFVAGGKNVILLGQLHALGDDFVDSIGGEAWHEVVHAKRVVGALIGDPWNALVAHAASLGVMDVKWRTYLRAIGRADWSDAGEKYTIRHAYNFMYEGRADKQEVIDQESVTHMLDLGRAGYFSADQLKPIRDIVEANFPGYLPSEGIGGADVMEPTTRAFKIDGYDGSVETRVTEAGFRSRRYAVQADGKDLIQVTLIERDPNVWQAVGIRIVPEMQGKGVAVDVFQAIAADLGRGIANDGILTKAAYEQTLAADPARVRYHVAGGKAFDGLYLPAQSVEALRRAVTEATKAGLSEDETDETARLGAALSEIEAQIPDAYYADSRMLAALTPDAAPKAETGPGNFDLLRRAVALHLRLHNAQYGKQGPTSSEITNHAIHLAPILGIGAAHQALVLPMVQGDLAATAMTIAGGPLALSWQHIREVAKIYGKLKAQAARAEAERMANGQPNDMMAALRPTPLHLPKLGDLGKADTKAVETGLSDLVTLVNEALNTESRMGRLNPGMKAAMGRLGAKLYGHFSRATGIIRMAIPNDLPTLVHEGGHALEIHPDLGPLVEGIKQTYAHELVPLATPGGNALSEGWAEWFRSFLVEPQAAATNAPGTAQAFRTMLEAQSPEMLQALEAIQVAYQTLQSASPAGVVLSRTKSTVKPDGFLAEKRQDVADKGWRGAISDWLYAATRDLTDSKHPIQRATRFLIDEASRNLSAANKIGAQERIILKAINDPYKHARMMEHARIHATSVLQNGVRRKGHDLPTGPSMRDALVAAFGGSDRKLWNNDMAQKFGAYLIARRMNAEWDRYDVGSLDAPPDHLMTRDAWGKAQNDLEKAHPQFAKAGRILDLFMRNTLRWKHENGFLTQDLYDELRLRDGYAPLNRIMDKDGPSSLKAKGQNKRSLIMKFKGSTRDFINPIESIVADVYATQARIELNETIKALDKLARAAGPHGGKIAERIPAKDLKGTNVEKLTESLRKLAEEQVRKAVAAGAIAQWDAHAMMQNIDLAFDQDASKVLFKATDTNEKGERIVYLWENGEKVPILLGSDQLGEDIWNIFAAVGNPSDMGAGLEAAVYFTQFFRAGVTKSPVYIVTNWFRDQLATWALSRDFTPFWTGLRGMRDVVKQGDAVKRYNAWAGQGGGVDSHLIDTMGRQGDSMQLRENGYFAAPTRWQKFLRTMEISELASRVAHMEAAYQRMLADGLSEEEAAFEAAYNAHDVMDFSKRGSRTMAMARLVAFLNAQIQGLSAALRTMGGKRDDYVNVRDAITPYLKAADGHPLSIGEREALPNSMRIWVKLVAIGLIGLALKWINWDDPEHEELSRGDMGFTHWFVKVGGHWWRAPKPFELAIFSNLFEAMFDRLAKNDPTAATRFLKSIRDTVLLNPEMQTANVISTVYHGATGLLDSLTGKSQYAKDKSDIPQRLKGLPPEMQWDAYTSELSKLLAGTFGMSPYKTDNVIRSLFATVGKDVLTASDYVLPRLNMALGGVLPGVMKEPRADKSMEDYWFLSRITRRSSRGAYSTYQFWQEMSQDNGSYAEAYKGYHNLLDVQKSQRDAQAMLMKLDPDKRAYAVLMEHYKEQDKDLHPMHRAEQAIGAINGIRRQMAEGHLFRDATMKKGKEADRIVVSPSTQRIVNEVLEDMAMREARNAQVVLGKPGWANAGEMRTEGLWKELRAASPDVADELEYRLTHGKHKVYSYDAVKAAWPQVKQHLLTEDPGTSLASFRSDVKGGGDPVPPAQQPDGVRPPGMMRLGGPLPKPDTELKYDGVAKTLPVGDAAKMAGR